MTITKSIVRMISALGAIVGSQGAIAGTAFAMILGTIGVANAAPPDLTASTNRFAVDRTYTYNLGPTGMRGWLYRNPDVYGPQRAGAGALGMATDPDRQILVTDVGMGTPARAIIQTNDVILGVTAANSGAVPLFSNDCRKAFGWTIGEAEAGNGALRIRINRYGVSTDQYYTIQLGLTGLAYSSSAPYNCPKSAKILANAILVITNMSNDAMLALAKIAVGMTNSAVKSYAASIAPAPGSIDLDNIGTWDIAYKSIFLAEYFLYTGDTSVTNGIQEYARKMARANDNYGCVGHKAPHNKHDGTWNGAVAGYGPMNSVSIPYQMGIYLGKRCGIAHPDIDASIARAGGWFGYHVDKGSFQYGQHPPWGGHCSNGKDEMGAMYFALQGDKPGQAKYFLRLGLSGYIGRESGHTGQGFSYLWSALAAHQGGVTSLVEYVKQIRWHLDLSRRSNGSFIYDGAEQYGGSAQPSYWGSATYYGNPNAYYVLLFSQPLRKILITGRELNPTNQLELAEISNAMWAATYDLVCSGFTTNQLMAHFSEYDPSTRLSAALALAAKPNSNLLVNTLIAMTADTNSRVRATACLALGAIRNTGALATLCTRMYDTDVWVRTCAKQALNDFGSAANSTLWITNMLTAMALHGPVGLDSYATNMINWADPVIFGNDYLAELLFNTLGATTINQATNVLYPAVAAGLMHPTGHGRSQMGSVNPISLTLGGFLSRLDDQKVRDLAPSIVACAKDTTPADRMWGHDAFYASIATLAQRRMEEGIPLCIRAQEKYWSDWGGYGNTYTPCRMLSNYYGTALREALPVFTIWKNYWPTWVARGGSTRPEMDGWISSLYSLSTNTAAPPALQYFKTVTSFSASAPAITLPTNIAFRCTVTDRDNNPLSYTWSKTQGAGSVTFTPNNSPDATNVTALFSAPGTYVIRMACVDKSILDTTTWKWSPARNCVWDFWTDFQTYTNLLGAVYTNMTVTVYGQPHIAITNTDDRATDSPQESIVGTNSAFTVGDMQLTCVADGATNCMVGFGASLSWSIIVTNLVPDATNYVTVTGTNGMGIVAGDTVAIYRRPIPYLAVTNVTGSVMVPDATITWRMAGTNTLCVVGGLVWTNAAIGGGNGTVDPAPGDWSFDVDLVPGYNVVTVYGTNIAGVTVTATATVIRGTPPRVDITNLVAATVINRLSTTTDEYIAGTNTASIAGGLQWTNALGGGGALPMGGWSFTAPLAHGVNVIVVSGTNVVGAVLADTAVVFRATAPFMDITNEPATVAMAVDAVTIGGTNNAAPVGMMRLSSIVGATTNHVADVPAASPWTVMVSNLLADATNHVMMTVTNLMGESAGDTIEIYRRPIACVDITNVIGQISVTTETQYVAGTNNTRIVGGMWWTNNLAAGGTLNPAPGAWSFTAGLYIYNGTNIITVYGTNLAGDVASDSVTVIVPKATGKDLLTFGPGAVITGTNVAWRVPYGTDVTALSPVYTVSPKASGSPLSGTTRNFTAPQEYTVTAEDLSTRKYRVTVTVAPKLRIHMNYDRSDAPASSSLTGPCGGLGEMWNSVATDVTWPGVPTTDSNLVDFTGAPVNVKVYFPQDTAFWSDGTPALGMLKSHRSVFALGGSWKVELRELDPKRIYDIYFGAYRASGGKGWYITTNVTAGARTNYYDNAGGTTSGSRWIEGSNYVRFIGVMPSANGTIYFTIVGADGYRAQLNGFQIAEATPAPFIDITNASPVLADVNQGLAIAVAGTNNLFVAGSMWISNAANASVATFPATKAWTSASVNVSPAPGTTNRVYVYGTNDAGNVGIDSIIVISVPEPAAGTAALFVIGYSLLVGAKRRGNCGDARLFVPQQGTNMRTRAAADGHVTPTPQCP